MDAERSSASAVVNMEDGWKAGLVCAVSGWLPSPAPVSPSACQPVDRSERGVRDGEGAKEKGEKDKTWNKTGLEKTSDGGKKRKEVDRWTAVPTGCWGFPSFHPFVMRRRLVASSGVKRRWEFSTGEREKGKGVDRARRQSSCSKLGDQGPI
ncbi:hypothetical protein TEQG_02407 [Trichophyton equinum CBS 127.97]|uniref:Uncharacterized protein n=1 Tax=Trichophyton equinum (strain ATCC MYA-4606 / CBS 127.97) TaxID=559882 RepID=F2PNA3_TRIEC|nr:hypothetical protein TEQG_02407 [Trichophyton equinum CBS 127.97]